MKPGVEAPERDADAIADADDKVVYSFVPQMIKYYLAEDPILPNVPSYLCYREKEREHVLGHVGHVHAAGVGDREAGSEHLREEHVLDAGGDQLDPAQAPAGGQLVAVKVVRPELAEDRVGNGIARGGHSRRRENHRPQHAGHNKTKLNEAHEIPFEWRAAGAWLP